MAQGLCVLCVICADLMLQALQALPQSTPSHAKQTSDKERLRMNGGEYQEQGKTNRRYY